MPMKTIEGYSKEKYTNTSVLLAGGGAKVLSDFIGSLSWDSTNKKIKYTPVGGSATDLVTLSWDNIANKPTSLPANGGDADTVDNYHASNLTKFYLSPMSSGAPADSAKSWFIDTMPSASGAIVDNVPGSEKTIIAGKSSGLYGHMLQLNYDDNYLRILRYQSGSWKTTDWEKISAGYADSAGNADTVDGQHLITQVSDWNTDSLSIFKSSENSISNAPTTDFIYGLTLRFHRDFATYHTDLVTSLYHDRLFFRRKTESGYGEWRELIHSGNIGSQSVNYADSAGSIAWGNVTGKPFNWSGQSGQPTWLWGSNDGTNYYVWNPSNFSVNYAKSATSLGSGALKYMCSLYAGSTYNAYKITTDWHKSSNIMPTINIRGYAYGTSRTIDCDIVMYHYNNDACNYSLTNKGSYAIRVWQAIENDVQVFYINPGEYFGMFNVFVYGGMGTDAFSNWSMTTVDSVSGTEIGSVPIATSITGNADTVDGYHASSFSLSTHTHTFNLGNTTITTNGDSYSGITGPFNIYTNASSSNAFTICRDSLDECVEHWVDDGQYHIDYTNDETSSSIHIRIINTDTESGNKTNTTDYHYYLDCYGNFYPGSNNTGSIGTSGYKWANMYATTFHGSLDGNATSATSATSATQATNLTPENTAHYFRDPNNSSWRGGMIWGSAGNESMSFVVANSGTRFQFVGGSDITTWGSSTWQSVNPYLTIYSSGIVTPGSATASEGFIKSGYDNTYALLAGGGHKLISDFATAEHTHDGRYLRYEGWWSSGSGQNVDDANGMTFVYRDHGSPNGWGILCTFDYTYNSGYKFQLFAEGYSADGMYYRCRSSDRGGWTSWKTVIDSGNIGSQSVSYASSAGSVAWGNVTGKPSTFEPSSHDHDTLYPKKDGTGASGTLGINITGSSEKLSLTSCYNGTTNNDLWSTIKSSNSSYLGTATIYEVYNDGGPDTYGEVLDIISVHNNHWQPQLWFGSGKSGRLRYRNKEYNDNSWGDWRTVAWTSDIPSVGNGTVTVTQAGSTIGSFTMNQSGNTLIALNDTNTNYYPIRSYTTGLQISSYSGSADCALFVPYATNAVAGVVSTATQSFAGQKTFLNGIKVGSTSSDQSTDNAKIYFGDGKYVWIGESPQDDALMLNCGTGKNIYFSFAGSTAVTSSNYSTYAKIYMSNSGAVYASSGFYESSDERLKRILNPVKVNLDDLSKLRKVYYLWRDKSKDGIQLGMIAQDVQRLYPELVSVDKETGYLSLAYDKLSVIALEAIDTLYEEYKQLKERVNKLEKLLHSKEIL